jgi:hypothetical protein
MTEAEWLACDDARRMLDYLQGRWSGMPEVVATTPAMLAQWKRHKERLHQYLVDCCFEIWPLLPQEASRRGVEVAELFIAGLASEEQLYQAEWDAEAAVFTFDYDTELEAIKSWVVQLQAMPEAQLQGMLHPPGRAPRLEPRELLRRAASFADHTITFPLTCGECPAIEPFPASHQPGRHDLFLSAKLLREHVSYHS